MARWLRFSASLANDPRTLKAKRDADIPTPQLIGHLHLIWSWALEFAETGDLADFEPWMIEEIAQWDGEPDALYNALVGAEFIFVDDEADEITATLADWSAKQ